MVTQETATALFGVAAVIYVAATLILKHLVGVVGDVFPQSQANEYAKSAYFSVGVSFLFAGGGVVFLAGSVVDQFAVPASAIPVSTNALAGLGTLSLIVAAVLPSYTAGWICLSIYTSYRKSIRSNR